MAKRPDDGDRMDDPYIDDSELSPAPSRSVSSESASPNPNTQPVFEVEMDSDSERLESLEWIKGPELFADREHEVMPELAEPESRVASNLEGLERPLVQALPSGPEPEPMRPKETFQPLAEQVSARKSRLDALLKIVKAKMEAKRVKLYCI